MNGVDHLGLEPLAAAVDAAIPADLAHAWAEHVAASPVLVARQGVFRAQGAVFAYQLSFRSQDRSDPESWTSDVHERATSHVLRATFARDDLESLVGGRHVMVRCPRGYLVDQLPLPPRPDRLIVELPPGLEPDAQVRAGIADLRARGFRFALPAFSDQPEQRQLLPLVDFVKIDVRDLDVEGVPVVRVARSAGATLVGEFVERPEQLALAQDLGFTLFQGSYLGRATTVDRAAARPVGL
ncbi:MAG: EAL domain-containing protein [Micrococcales bacterium]|nr:EAL domain-containing protein [Micrococcales bacterium]